MFKKIIINIVLCISLLHLNAYAEPLQIFNNINNLEVAHVWVDGVNVRAKKSTKSKIIDVLNAGQQVEVVARYAGWAKVCITLDSYGYVNDQYIQYRNYLNSNNDMPKEYYVNIQQQQNNDLIIAEQPTYIYYDNEIQEVYIEENNDITEQQFFTEENSNQYNYYEQQQYSYTEETPVYTTQQEYQYQTEYYLEETTYIEESQNNYDETYYQQQQDYDDSYQQIQSQEYTYEEENYQQQNAEEEYDTADSSNSSGQYLSDYAQQYIGNPYVWGGTSLETGADCSGFTLAVLGANGITVNGRTAADQAQGGTQVSLNDAQAGDLIYYDDGNGIYHIAIYNGDGTVTHSSSSSTGVTVSDMNYSGNAAGAVRYW